MALCVCWFVGLYFYVFERIGEFVCCVYVFVGLRLWVCQFVWLRFFRFVSCVLCVLRVCGSVCGV